MIEAQHKNGLSLSAKLHAKLDEPVSAASLSVFRICFATLAVCLVFEYFHARWVDTLLSGFHFSVIPNMTTIPYLPIQLHLILVAACALLIGLGLRYRFACAAFFILYTWIFLLEKSLYQNHLYLICLLSFLFFCVDGNRLWSLDNLSGRLSRTVPLWQVWLFRFQICVVYFFGGVAKLNADWLNGNPQTDWLLQRSADLSVIPILANMFQQHWFVSFITYGGILIDFSVPFLLCFRRTFLIGAILAVCFHLLNIAMWNIDVFPPLMIASIGLFGPPDWPEKFLSRLEAKAGKARVNSSVLSLPMRQTSTMALALVSLYALAQIILPVRRFLYPGDTSWTEEGQLFAWRMMLRDKRSHGFQMIFVDPKHNVAGVIHPEVTLDEKQMDDLRVIPNMMLQFAHHAADAIEYQTGARPIVRAQAIVSLNGRPPQNLIDKTVDLAAAPYSLGHASWILPLKEK